MAGIRARLAAATPGPWALDSFDDPRESRNFTAVDAEPLVCSTTRYDADYDRFLDGRYDEFDDERFLAEREADCQLVANAPVDLGGCSRRTPGSSQVDRLTSGMVELRLNPKGYTFDAVELALRAVRSGLKVEAEHDALLIETRRCDPPLPPRVEASGDA